MDLTLLEQQLNIRLMDKKLYKQAFTHSSFSHERKKKGFFPDNERLEFLGDAVLELTVSHFLFHRFPLMSEGELTRTRARMVCETSLASFARELNLGHYIRLGKGEERTGGRLRSSLLADVFEAFMGALFLDQGLQVVQQFLEQYVFVKIDEDWLSQFIDAKSQLQEYVQRGRLGQLQYSIVEMKGPAHERQFVAEVSLNQNRLGQGVGRSKKEAEQQAAAQALTSLVDDLK